MCMKFAEVQNSDVTFSRITILKSFTN